MLLLVNPGTEKEALKTAHLWAERQVLCKYAIWSTLGHQPGLTIQVSGGVRAHWCLDLTHRYNRYYTEGSLEHAVLRVS